MIYQHRHLTRTTHLELREHGLYLSQRNGATRLDAELPYEEMLPVQLERRHNFTLGFDRLFLWALILVAYSLKAAVPGTGFSNETWLLLFGIPTALVAVYFYGSRYWWNHLIINTSRTTVVVPDGGPANRRAAAAFTLALERRAKAYLREQHAQVNPLGIIEPQLRRLRWLHQLDVLSADEAQALATRLTGRRGAPELHGMGQRLEAPYLN